MDNLVADFTININEPLQAEFVLGNSQTFDCSFELFAAGTVWGSIDGDISNQTDLKNALDSKADASIVNELSEDLTDLATTVSDNYTALENDLTSLSSTVDNNYSELSNRLLNDEQTTSDLIETVADNYTELNGKISVNTGNITSIQNTINSYGNIVSYNATDFATAAQGTLADTALQSGDNITELVNNAGYITGINSTDVTTALGYIPYNSTNPNGYITSADLPTVNNATLTIQTNGADVATFTANSAINQIANIIVPTTASDINALPDNTKYGKSIDVLLNTTDYKLTISLKDQDGTILNSKVVDFPVESMVVSGSFDSVNKKIILTLQNGNTTDIPIGDLISGLQTEITSNNKLDSDLVDDTNQINKFVTTTEKSTWNNKQDTISDLASIRSNATNGQNAYTTIQNYGNIVTHNTNEFATATQGGKADTALQPNDNISELINDSGYITNSALNGYATENFVTSQGYITGIDSTDVTTALGYTPVNPSSLATVATSGDYDDLSNKPTIPTVGDGTITITQGGVTKGTFTTNQSGNSTIALDAGGGGSSYSAGTGIVISNDTISIDTSVVAQLSDIPTNYVTTDTAQNISGRKTFLGEKAIYFKQSATTNKLGFTLYNPSDTELGAFEWRPSTINGGALLNINVPYSSSNYVGFRYWGTAVNIIAPKVATAGNYYIPTHITNGNTTVTANSSGTVDISSLISGGGSGGIQNTATGTDSLTILGTPSTGDSCINIGLNSQTSDDAAIAIGAEYDDDDGASASDYSVAIGTGAVASSSYSVAIGAKSSATNVSGTGTAIGSNSLASGEDSIALGEFAEATAINAYQIGEGTNNTAYSFQVDNKQLLNLTTGLIPDARLSSNIARTSQIPTAISDLTDDTATTPIDKAESVVDNNSGSLNFWSGTKAQYDAIVTKDANTLYNITDDANPTLSILEMLYPVGSIYIGTMSACPLQTLGVGTWQLVATDRVLQGAGTRGSVGTTVNESLPNIKGNIEASQGSTGATSGGMGVFRVTKGAFTGTANYQKCPAANTTGWAGSASNLSIGQISLNASRSSSTYQDDAPVQQDAYVVNIWERIS